MNYTITILRQADRSAEPYRQTVLFATDDAEMTVATLLKTLNATPNLTDTDSKAVSDIDRALPATSSSARSRTATSPSNR